MALIITAIFRSQIVESIILSSAVMDEYKFVNPSAPPAFVKAFSLPPAYPDQIQFQPPTLPQNWVRQGCRRKTKTRSSDDGVDHHDFNYKSTIGNSLHDIQKVSLCILLYQGYASPCTHSA